jgi:hypothetical protein
MSTVDCTLHPSQRAALAHIADYARARSAQARQAIAEIQAMSNLAADAFERGVANIKRHARIGLHFHPDRPHAQLQTVAESLLSSGLYKSQFETLISNGSVSAVPGGPRDVWEQKLFGGAYQLAGTTVAQRAKYGALALLQHADGPAPRFGSCYFLLAPRVSSRATFSYLDSHQEPLEKGCYDELDDIVAALFKESFTRDFALGEAKLPPTRLLEHLLTELAQPFADPALRAPTRNLNHYIEAQVHGDVRLREDVEILVCDPSFRGTATGNTLERICERYAIDRYWHAGFALTPSEVPVDFRGAWMPSLATRVACDGLVDAAAIGCAARELARDPASWSDRGSQAEVLQELKLLWHVLVRFGHAARA